MDAIATFAESWSAGGRNASPTAKPRKAARTGAARPARRGTAWLASGSVGEPAGITRDARNDQAAATQSRDRREGRHEHVEKRSDQHRDRVETGQGRNGDAHERGHDPDDGERREQELAV